ncbi:MAG: hypothetical protein ACI8QZ_001401 [Chlamydiales bacterium]|jgi:hypothetical protein
MRASVARSVGIVGTFLFSAALLLGISCVSSGRLEPSLKGHGVDAWAAYLVGDPAESAWRDIPWIPSLAEGVQAARQADRPLLLWMMNGHPLGCT